MSSIHRLRKAGLISLFAVAVALPVAAQEYSHGNGALELFDAEGQANAPAWVKVWLPIMLGTFVASLVFVWKRVEARWVAGGVIAGFVTMGVLVGAFGVPQLSGFIAVIHLVFWTPALIVLLRRRTFLKERSIYAGWTGLVTFVILFSFVFDIRDAAIYADHMLGLGVLS